MKRRRFDEVGASALGVLAASYFVFWGCYLASPQLRPAVPLPAQQNVEVGAQAYGTFAIASGAGAGAYGRFRLTPRLEIGGGLRMGGMRTATFFYFGDNAGFTTVADVGVRGLVAQRHQLTLSLDLSLVGEAALIGRSLPLAAAGVRLGAPIVWDAGGWGIYTMPAAGLGVGTGTPLDAATDGPVYGAELRVPVGGYLAFPMGDRLRLTTWAEAGIAGALVTASFFALASGYGAAGVGLQF